jgi:hypothetical protein
VFFGSDFMGCEKSGFSGLINQPDFAYKNSYPEAAGESALHPEPEEITNVRAGLNAVPADGSGIPGGARQSKMGRDR